MIKKMLLEGYCIVQLETKIEVRCPEQKPMFLISADQLKELQQKILMRKYASTDQIVFSLMRF